LVEAMPIRLLAITAAIAANVAAGIATVVVALTTLAALPTTASAQVDAKATAMAASTPAPAPASGAQVLEAVRAKGAKVVLVNLWATWCTPCREEFPDLMRFYRAYEDRGVSLVLVSGDFSSETEAARDFLATQGVDFASYLKSGKDEEFIDAFDPAWSGALPATFVYDSRGQRKHSFLGPITYQSLETEVAPLLAATP
jgi:thiol-disulfide isomerase/thioredoxin